MALHGGVTQCAKSSCSVLVTSCTYNASISTLHVIAATHDDAIVMVENVERHLHSGKYPYQAAIYAARELVGPIIAMTITLAAVYAPLGIQGGLTACLHVVEQ